MRIVLNAESRRFDGETSESDKRRRLFNYHRGRVAETFGCWIFSGNKDNYVFTYTCTRISLSLWPFIWLNGGSELFRLNRSSLRERKRATLCAPGHTKIFTLLGRPMGEWISAWSNAWVHYTRLNAIFQFTLIDPHRAGSKRKPRISRA